MNIIDEEISNILNLLEIKKIDKKTMFSGFMPVYPFNTENISSVFYTYYPYIKDQDILTVTGSGDAILDLFLQGARSVTCFDSNKTAKHYAALKFAAVKAKLSFEEYKKFFYAEDFSSRLYDFDIYLRIREQLPDVEKRVWDAVYAKANEIEFEFDPRKTDITYQQFDNFIGFRCKNWSLYNKEGYFCKENYNKLLEAVEDKSFNDIIFIDSPLFDLDDHLQDKKFAFVYLSNIMDFTSTFIEGKSLNERLEIFKSFIKGIASRWIIENGIVVVSFVEGSRQFSDDTYYNVDKYRSKFDNVDDFYMLDILPSNSNDLIIVYCNKTLGKQLLINHDAYDFY